MSVKAAQPENKLKLKAEKENYRGKTHKLTFTIPAFSGIFLSKKSIDIRLD